MKRRFAELKVLNRNGEKEIKKRKSRNQRPGPNHPARNFGFSYPITGAISSLTETSCLLAQALMSQPELRFGIS